MCIYFIQAKQGGLIKIGYTNNPRNRLRGIQNSCPIKLKVLGIMRDASRQREEDLHRQFRRYREYGEWFEPAPAILSEVWIATESYEPEDWVKCGNRFNELPRCKGYSDINNRQCKNKAPYNGYCWVHKPKTQP